MLAFPVIIHPRVRRSSSPVQKNYTDCSTAMDELGSYAAIFMTSDWLHAFNNILVLCSEQ